MKSTPTLVLIMGVSGSGKSHVGKLLAEAIGADFIDADDHHSASSIAKMSRGEPLNDGDREGWLETLAGFFRDHARQGRSLVIGCSALKRRYRDQLRRGVPALWILYLHGSRELLSDRLTHRQGHFFQGNHMLDSQLRDLEPPGDDEAIRVDISLTPEEIIATFFERIDV